MAKYTTKGVVDGKEVDVELDDEKVIPREQHQVILEETVTSRLARQKRGMREAYLGDDEFVTEVLKTKGFGPNDKPGAKGGTLDAEAVEKMQKEIRDREVTPLQTKLSEGEKRESRILNRTLVAELERELTAKNVSPTVANRIAKLEASRFAFDDKSENFALREGDDFVFSSKATKDAPFKGVAEFAEEWASNKENAPFIVNTAQKGPNVGNGGTQIGTQNRAQLKTVEDRSKFISEHGLEAFQKLPAA